MSERLKAPFVHATATAGAVAVNVSAYAGSLALLFVQAVGGCFMRRTRAGMIFYEMFKVGVASWFIVAVSSLFIGMVLAFQSAYQMQQLAAEIYIASLVSLSIIREIGPVITALIVAGRVGSAIAAELGTMRVTEQIDALQTMAVDPVDYLVVPRLVALIAVLPLLTIWADAVGILGGYIIGTMKLSILPTLYWKMTFNPVVFKDLASGLLKSLVFGTIICIVSSFEGMRASGGAEGVGRATTRAVVSSFLLIIAADCIITAIFYFVWSP